MRICFGERQQNNLRLSLVSSRHVQSVEHVSDRNWLIAPPTASLLIERCPKTPTRSLVAGPASPLATYAVAAGIRPATPVGCGHEETDEAAGPTVPHGRDESKVKYTGRLPPVLFSYHPPTCRPTDRQSNLRPGLVGPSSWRRRLRRLDRSISRGAQPSSRTTRLHEVRSAKHQLFRAVRRICLFVLLLTVSIA